MIVDDEYLVMESILHSIPWEKVGFEITGMAKNGKAALALIEKNVPDVVITDIKMPVMDGIELITNINIRFPNIKVIILSSYNDFEYAQKAIDCKVFSYILKPIHEENLQCVFQKLYAELETQSKFETERKVYESIRIEKKVPDDNKNTLLDYMLLNLLKGNIYDKSILRLKLEELEFSIHEDCICIVAYSLDFLNKDQNASVSIQSVLQASREFWAKYHYHVLIINNIFNIIVNEKIQISERNLSALLGKFKSFIEDKLQSELDSFTISAGIGNTYSGIDKMPISYNEANFALQKRFFKGKGAIICYKELNTAKTSASMNHLIDKVIKEMVKGILDANMNSTAVALNSLFDILSSINFFSLNLFYVKCLQVYVSIVLYVKQKMPLITALKEDELYLQIENCDSLDELRKLYSEQILDITRQVNNLKNNGSHIIFTVKKYIDENFSKKISLTDLSETFHINATYLSNLFKKEAGINISEYIQSVKIESAKKLLESSNHQLQTISEKIGFTDYTYFCTVFKKITGISPLQYRLQSVMKQVTL